MNSKALRNWYEVPFIFSYLKVGSRTLAEMPKVQTNLDHIFFIREEVKILQ